MGPIPLVLAAVCEKGLHLHNPVFEDHSWQELCSLLSPKAYVGFRVCVCKSSTSVQKLRKELIGAEESCRSKCGHDPHDSALLQLSLRPSMWPCMGQVQSALMQLSLRPSMWSCKGKVQSEKQPRRCLQTRNISVACGCQSPFQYAPKYPVDLLLEDKSWQCGAFLPMCLHLLKDTQCSL